MFTKNKYDRQNKICIIQSSIKCSISYFHMNTHIETFALLITCITDETDGEMQHQVYQVDDVDELKQSLLDVWHGFEQSVINV